jgi:hypothetical protein
MTNSNIKNADIDLSAFNLSVGDFQIDEREVIVQTGKKLQQILDKEFPNSLEKRRYHLKERGSGEKRFNFACPYCGDSGKDHSKKRGNLYIPGYNFHCYNCRTHTSLETFLKDFGGELSPEQRVHVFESREDNKQQYNDVEYLDFGYVIDFEKLDNFAVDRKDLMKSLELVEMSAQSAFGIKKYLVKRFQTEFSKFAYDPKNHRLIIFNRLPNKKILGFQVRNFRKEPKYITYTLEMIYEIMGIKFDAHEEHFKEANRLSFLFGLETTDFTKPITVFEGPLDSFLYPNGMSTCGIDNDFPLDIPVKWLYDFDMAGIRKSLERLERGEIVFMWKKYMDDNKIFKNFNKFDYTDYKKYIKDNKKPELNADEYFTNDKFNAIFL